MYKCHEASSSNYTPHSIRHRHLPNIPNHKEPQSQCPSPHPPPPSPSASPPLPLLQCDTLHTQLTKFHSTVSIYRELFSKPGARTVNWAPLMDVKYTQLVQHNASLKAVKATLDDKADRTAEEEEAYKGVWSLYLAALQGYGDLCEVLKPRAGAAVATVGVRALEGMRGEGWVDWGVGSVRREGWGR
ncbi:uncharacterized protein LAJ45_03661 [Morchella importuna]|uniref:uncharacterized protein n=1 Tax=Morchella importuna TaxID=1174673 RepID=UPI001E8D0E3F|nr:uncharacterized protein LAJ45_03661 [Morchella importuna]KAH8152235.1 hypothetical protein LAJ45_03661 [Morchella importuna]